MSQPSLVPNLPAKPEKERLAELQRRREFRTDVLYIAGSSAVSMGLAMVRPYLGIIAIGLFCLLPPVLELASGFIRGLRPGPRRP